MGSSASPGNGTVEGPKGQHSRRAEDEAKRRARKTGGQVWSSSRTASRQVPGLGQLRDPGGEQDGEASAGTQVRATWTQVRGQEWGNVGRGEWN